MIFFLRFLQYLSPYILINFAIEKLVILPDKQNRNLISAIHCYLNIFLTLGSIIYSSNIMFLLAIFNSIGYFLYDLLYIIRKGLKETGYIVHHILSLGFLGYILSLELNDSFKFFLLLFIGELSNVLIYPVYHLIQINYQGEILEKLKWWQAFIYTICRIYGLPIFVLISGLEHNLIVYCLMVIYIMSFMWSYSILKKIN
jgi:hypothetical protein